MYWSRSDIMAHPELHHSVKWELQCMYHLMPSPGSMHAALAVANCTKACETPLVIVESVGSPPRMLYLKYPQFEDWSRLERAGFYADETSSEFRAHLDALH